ncbi:DENN domain-containing protein 5A [Cichlidogyrus casuarinus]|uniref:DENN domain-containing protein 5A n=1 Tax=Cichlidogyrus casuarinus TaxID=1844966 RepID=A0ABD2QIN0_9PLAT
MSDPIMYKKMKTDTENWTRNNSNSLLMSPSVAKPNVGNLLSSDPRQKRFTAFANASNPNSPAIRRNSLLSNDGSEISVTSLESHMKRAFRGSSIGPSLEDSCDTAISMPHNKKAATLSTNRAVLQASSVLAHSLGDAAVSLVRAVQLINLSSSSAQLSKEDRFQRLMCVGLRDHHLVSWISLLAMSPVTSQMYEERSIMLHPSLRLEVQTILASLDEYELQLEPVLLGVYPL